MKTTTIGQRFFLILSLIVPLLYLSMYLPIWNGKELTNTGAFSAILIIFQCICVVLAILRLSFAKFRNSDSCLLTFVFDSIVIISIILTCFFGFFFILELFHIPWFPAQD